MPVFNGSRFLATAIDSILAQSCDDFELIIADDGSTDGSRAIARARAGRDRRIVLVHGEHGGIPVALNRALGLARGEYFAPMDQDDVALPARLAVEAAYLDAHPDTVVVGGSATIIDDSGAVLKDKHYPTEPAAVAAAMHRACAILHPASMMRTDAARRIGGYRGALPFAQDYDLWLRLMETGEVANLADIVLMKRIHAGQVTSTRAQRPMQVVAGAVAYLSRLARSVRGEDFVGDGRQLLAAATDFIDFYLSRDEAMSADDFHHLARFMRYAPIERSVDRRVGHPYRTYLGRSFRQGGARDGVRSAAYVSSFLLYNRYKYGTLFPDESNLTQLVVQTSAST
jgi:glycosyltransferase involved in cell wall biosynthesis